MKVLVRREQPEDFAMVGDVQRGAFPSDGEARLVDQLRENGKALISLVAEVAGRIVGHILFSPVSIVEGDSEIAKGLGLAPMAVIPDFQGRGIGTDLVGEGLALSRAAGYGFVVVLGEPSFYRRFGFRQASLLRLRNEYGAEEAFNVLELRPGGLPETGGLVKYGIEFAELAA